MNYIEEKIERILFDCEKHIERMSSASKKMNRIMPMSKDTYVNLSDDQVEFIDQFLFRFSKLQDAIGKKLFKNILIYKEDDEQSIQELSFIDFLNILEKLNLLEAILWRELRNDRNELAHNYEDEPEEMVETINKIFAKRELLVHVFENIKNYYESL
mgnify:CR=1 FL=1